VDFIEYSTLDITIDSAEHLQIYLRTTTHVLVEIYF